MTHLRLVYPPDGNPQESSQEAHSLRHARLPAILETSAQQLGVETMDFDFSGFDTVTTEGTPFLVIAWEPQGGDGTPQGLSLQRQDCTPPQVRQFEIAPSVTGKEAEWMGVLLRDALHDLSQSQSFEMGMRTLETLHREGKLHCRTFSAEIESPCIAAGAEGAKQLAYWLEEQGVSTSAFGKGKAKSFESLVREVQSGECVLSLEAGEVYLESRVVLLEVNRVDSQGRLFKVVEDRQEFARGDTRRRTNLGGLIAEKLHPGEDPRVGALRALNEELGVPQCRSLQGLPVSRRIEPSVDYPGLMRRNTFYPFQAQLHERDVRPEYQEISEHRDSATQKPEKITYFLWEEVR